MGEHQIRAAAAKPTGIKGGLGRRGERAQELGRTLGRLAKLPDSERAKRIKRASQRGAIRSAGRRRLWATENGGQPTVRFSEITSAMRLSPFVAAEEDKNKARRARQRPRHMSVEKLTRNDRTSPDPHVKAYAVGATGKILKVEIDCPFCKSVHEHGIPRGRSTGIHRVAKCADTTILETVVVEADGEEKTQSVPRAIDRRAGYFLQLVPGARPAPVTIESRLDVSGSGEDLVNIPSSVAAAEAV